MQQAPVDPPIIITGGSVTVEFDPGPGQLQGGNGHHHHPDKKIRRIEVTGDGLDIKHDVKDPKVTIKVFYGD